MIAVKFLKRFLWGPRAVLNISRHDNIYSVNKLSWRHRLGESKPLTKLIDGVILRLRRR